MSLFIFSAAKAGMAEANKPPEAVLPMLLPVTVEVMVVGPRIRLPRNKEDTDPTVGVPPMLMAR